MRSLKKIKSNLFWILFFIYFINLFFVCIVLVLMFSFSIAAFSFNFIFKLSFATVINNFILFVWLVSLAPGS